MIKACLLRGANRGGDMSRMAAWWSSLGFNRALAPVDDDFADMGTAFGLDASMDTIPSAYMPPSAANPETPAALWPAERSGAPRR